MAGLPCASYEFAETEDGTKGVLSRRFLDKSSRLIPGNMLLARLTPGYDGTRTYNQIQYTLANALKLLRRLPLECTSFNGLTMKAVDLFVGYLVFDVWIGNTDRHHENWVFARMGDDELRALALLALGPGAPKQIEAGPLPPINGAMTEATGGSASGGSLGDAEISQTKKP